MGQSRGECGARCPDGYLVEVLGNLRPGIWWFVALRTRFARVVRFPGTRAIRRGDDCADALQESVGGEGLLQELHTGIEYTVLDNGVFGVARAEEDFRFGPALHDEIGQGAAANAGHD